MVVGPHWTSYFVPLVATGRTQICVEWSAADRAPATSAAPELWVTSLAVVDSVVKEREQQHIGRSDLNIDRLVGQLRDSTDTASEGAHDRSDEYLASVEGEWETFAKEDPLFYILTDHSKRDRGWDPTEFFELGEGEIVNVMDLVDSRNVPLTRGRALDFGCGVGRLTQGLARVFDRVDGVDISPSMINAARRWNRHGDRARYHVNQSDDLALFGDEQFDFIYSNIVLQHVRPKYVEKYLAEFMRILRPGGVVVFQMPSAPHRDRLGLKMRFMTERARVRYISRRANYHGVLEFHWINRRKVIRLLRQLGGSVEEVQRDHSVPAISFRYCVRKPARLQRAWGIHYREARAA
jgi:SAM-dependent methyltransferase